MRTDQRAQLALLVEAAATPTPGNVDRQTDHSDLRLEHFLAGAIGAADGLASAAAGGPLGESFERSVGGMAEAQTAGNTQFGALLLLIPLVRAAANEGLTSDGVMDVVESSTVADAVAFMRAFDHVEVGVGEPPDDLADLDVRHPERAVEAVEARTLTLAEVMAASAAVDGIAREWSTGFDRTFEAADRLLARSGPLSDRAATVYLELLAATPDTFVAKRHGDAKAATVCEAARAVLEGDGDVQELAATLHDQGVNPGTTADLLAGGLFVALERGVPV